MTLPTFPRRAWVEVDLGALERNYRRLAARMAPARILAVVKADGYGHGAVAVAQALEPLGVAGFGVATLEEGVELRAAGIAAPVHVLSPVPDEGIGNLFDHQLLPIVSSVDQLSVLRARAEAEGIVTPLHLKFDTGMTRLGIDLADAPHSLAFARESPALRLEGVMSHLGEAETPESRTNLDQLRLFTELLSLLDRTRESEVVRHLANSAAALHLPQTRFDQVRLGIALYGYDSAGRGISGLDLEPVMSVEAEVVQARDLAAGRRVGYGGRWVAEAASRVAIVPLGYADGYSWRLGNRAEVLLRGRRAPVAGSVSMDLLAVDATATGAEVGDRVVLLGAQGEDRVTAFELAQHVGTIPYQLLCLFGLRLPRRHVRHDPEAAGATRAVAAGKSS